MKTLVTKRLILRHLKLTDAPDLFAYAHKPNIGPMAGWPPHRSVQNSLNILKLLIKEDDTWAITLKAEDRLIGTIGLHARDFYQALDNKKELGYALDDIYWGQGIVLEAAKAVINYGFVEIELDEILCGHYKHNHQSKRVIEKLGFEFLHEKETEDYQKYPVVLKMYHMTRMNYLEKRFQYDNTGQKI
jgi:RimJ/RimL family protein N-acetyltransferase